MGPVLDAIETSQTLPEAADVAIVGGGIVGLSAALFLARARRLGRCLRRRAVRRRAVEPQLGLGAPDGARPPGTAADHQRRMRLWDGMAATVGRDVGFRRTGILYLCESEADVEKRRDWLRRAGDYALDTEIVTGEALAALLPGATLSFPAALYTPSDGRAEPQKAAPAIAAAAVAAGATLLGDCAVREIETVGGRVSGDRHRARTHRGGERGGRRRRLVERAVPHARREAAAIGRALLGAAHRAGRGRPRGRGFGAELRLSQAAGRRLHGRQGVLSRHDVVADSFRYLGDFTPMLALEWRNVAVRIGTPLLKSLEGTPLRSRLEDTRILDPEPWTSQLQEAYAALQRAFPAFQGVAVAQEWAGVIDATPDAIPVISPVESRPGLFVATGFSGHGFGIGPGAGRLVADLVTGAKPLVDPAPFRHSRFTDGSRPRPTTGV